MKSCMPELLKKRRSIYNLGNKEVVSDKKIIDIVEAAVTHCPSAFNSQSGRVVLLFNEQHQDFWQLVHDTLKKVVPENKFQTTSAKIDTFAQARGTILFFEDANTISDLEARFPLYKNNFWQWSEHSSGMLQYIVWTMLAEQNVGASLQHYNPLIDNEIKAKWNLPSDWRLIAQMPFGNIVSPADSKSVLPISERVKIFQ